MSMNVRFGTRSCSCDAIQQTPTEDTYKIVRSDDPMAAYIEWLRTRGFDDETVAYNIDRIKAYAADHPTAEWTAS